MQPETVFSVCNTTALIAWIVLIAGYRKQWAPRAARWFSLGFAVVYSIVIALHFRGADGDFGSLEGVMTLFTNPWAVTAGWVHYLAFDLFVGAAIVDEGQQQGLPWWRVMPALPLTFLFGPAGWLLFTILRGRAV